MVILAGVVVVFALASGAIAGDPAMVLVAMLLLWGLLGSVGWLCLVILGVRIIGIRRFLARSVEVRGRLLQIDDVSNPSSTETVWAQYRLRFEYSYGGRTYRRKISSPGIRRSFRPGAPVSVLVDPKRPSRATLAAVYA